MSQIQIGSIIKAYDFPGTTNCYIIGEVTKIDGDYIVATKIKEVFGGKTKFNVSGSFRAPKQGMNFGDADFQRIVLVG